MIKTPHTYGLMSVTVPNWSMENREYTVKVLEKDGSPVNEDEYYHLLKAAMGIEQFLQKATGGNVTLADITVENGRIKGLEAPLDKLFVACRLWRMGCNVSYVFFVFN